MAMALATALMIAPAVFGLPNIFDEGFVASGGMLILRGGLPIRDFFVIYGPGQYYLTAAIFAAFGEDLYFTRVVHLAMMCGLGALLLACAGAMTAWRWPYLLLCALAYALIARIANPASGYAAIPATALLLMAATTFSRAQAHDLRRLIVVASLLVGLAGVMRWDFGVFGIVALATTSAGLSLAKNQGLPAAIKSAAVAALPALAFIALAFAPFVLLGGAARWFNEVPLFHLLEFKNWRNLAFFTPALMAAAAASSSGDILALGNATLKLVFASLPSTVALLAGVLAAMRLWRQRERSWDAPDVLALVLALMTALLFNQMRVRSGWPQGFPAYVTALPLTGYLLAAIPQAARWRGGFAWGTRAVVALALVVLPFGGVLSNLRTQAALVVPSQLLTRGSGVSIPGDPLARQRWAEYVDLVRYLQQITAPGEAIFSGVLDTSQLFVNDAMIYFLADRPAASRWVEMEPGLTNSERGQRELVSALEQQRVRTLVLLNVKSNREPNATASSNGILLLDQYVKDNFVVSRVFGGYRVMVRRAP